MFFTFVDVQGELGAGWRVVWRWSHPERKLSSGRDMQVGRRHGVHRDGEHEVKRMAENRAGDSERSSWEVLRLDAM